MSNCGVFGGCRVFVLVAVAAVVVGDSDIVRYDNADVETNENLSQQPEELGNFNWRLNYTSRKNHKENTSGVRVTNEHVTNSV